MIQEIRYPHITAKVVVKDENEHIQRHWLGGCFYEAKANGLLNYLKANVDVGGKWIDIGASIGNHTLFFYHVMLADEIVSFEPLKSSYEHLKENVELNRIKNIDIINCALGSEDGTCSMESIHPQQIGMTQVREGDDTKLMRIDSLNVFDGYDVIKIDVEHYNEELLKGAKETFTKGKGLIFIEAECQEELEIVDKYMLSYGYNRKPEVKLNSTPTYLYEKI